jgi:hypothetical protein
VRHEAWVLPGLPVFPPQALLCNACSCHLRLHGEMRPERLCRRREVEEAEAAEHAAAGGVKWCRNPICGVEKEGGQHWSRHPTTHVSSPKGCAHLLLSSVQQ